MGDWAELPMSRINYAVKCFIVQALDIKYLKMLQEITLVFFTQRSGNQVAGWVTTVYN